MRTMRYKLLGRSGLAVSELCLGAMTFGEEWGWGASEEECRRMFDTFALAGGNFIDTAHFYTNGTSERLVGQFIARQRDHWVLSTKYGYSSRPGDPNAGGAHRKSMVQQVEQSLARLGTDRIDVYWVHGYDPLTPLEEVVDGLDDLIRSGKVLYVGISNTPAWAVSRAVTLAEELDRRSRFVALQVPYSLVCRDIERELLPMARGLDLAATTWGPLGSGWLSGRYRTGRDLPPDTRIATTPLRDLMVKQRNYAIADRLVEVAEAHGATPAQAALAWVRAQQDRGTIIPIVGARTRTQLEETLGALDLELTREDLQQLDEVSRIELGFPHDSEGAAFVRGDAAASIDPPTR